ncbi:MAG: queuosine precursor transporter [bacterium]|nr:queuosine precursor transporter [bacterium]
MPISLAIFWIIIISAFVLLGAWYARRHNRPDALTALYVTLVVFANIAASKTIAFDFGFTTFFTPAAVLIFSVTFLLTDIVNEKFGKKETQRMILIALFAQIALVLFSYLILKAPSAPFFQNQAAFEAVLGTVPRIVLASLIAFYVSENLDAHLFHWIKKLTGGKHLWMRNAFSSLPSMVVDSIIFVTIAFYGLMPIMPLIIGLSVVKWLVGIIDIPFMYLSRAILGKQKAI